MRRNLPANQATDRRSMSPRMQERAQARAERKVQRRSVLL
jgi:hypothetical protein